jgi:hypothetical protein
VSAAANAVCRGQFEHARDSLGNGTFFPVHNSALKKVASVPEVMLLGNPSTGVLTGTIETHKNRPHRCGAP